MKKYTWFKKFIGSMAPTDLYTYCQKEKFISTFLYLLILILMVSIAGGGYLGLQTKHAFDQTIDDFENGKLAPISYNPEKGMVYEGDEPAIIKYFYVPVIIDTKESMSANELYKIKNYFFIGNKSFLPVQENIQFSLPLSQYQNLLVSEISFSDIKSLLLSLSYTTIPIFMLTFNIVLWMFIFASAIFVFLIINIINMFRGMKVKFSKLLQFIIYSMTAPIVWKAILYILLIKQQMPIDSTIMMLDNFLVYIYPVLILSVFFRRVKLEILK